MTVNMQAIHFSADKKLLVFIEKKLEKLGLYFDRIQKADVILKLENSGQIKEKVTEIRISIPGTVLFVKEHAHTFEASVDTAVAALKRQIVRYKGRKSSY
ncbi:MAG: ribosome-associated translation inhibitor RaiA [Saprospiraceae bacterium]|nr:ribosome-associated translation inhibitor RaiA [Saprospiraceae bacterium]